MAQDTKTDTASTTGASSAESAVLTDGLDAYPIYFTCPFCRARDYDLIGLKIHYKNGWCDEFNDLETGRKGV